MPTKDFLLYQQEKTVLEVTELICEVMTQLGVSREKLASLLKMDTARISAIIDGSEDATIRTISDIFSVLNVELTCSWRKVNKEIYKNFVNMTRK